MKKLWIVVLAVVLAGNISTLAQASGYEKKGRGYQDGSYKGSASYQDDVAIDGFCPVCIYKGKYMKGTPEYTAEYRGKTYYFVGQKQKDTFLANPERYWANLEKKYRRLQEDAKMDGRHHHGHKGSDHHEQKGSGYEKKGSGY